MVEFETLAWMDVRQANLVKSEILAWMDVRQAMLVGVKTGSGIQRYSCHCDLS